MGTTFYPVTIKHINRESDDCVTLSFDIPASLRETFQYKPGQYITIRTTLDGEELRRSYSLCSSPLDDSWEVAIKKVQGGAFSGFANEHLKAGDTLELLPPNGRFGRELHPLHAKKYMAFAAGSGITPVLSIIRTALRTEAKSEFTLVYGNRYRSQVLFKEVLEGLKNKYMSRFRIIYVLSGEKTDAPLNYGRIDKDKCALLFSKLVDPLEIDAYFLCGPEAMIFNIKDYLAETGVEDRRIHFELFSTGRQATKQVTATLPGTEAAVSMVSIRKDGRESSFSLLYEGESILDAALHEGADLPYACKGGVCCTCKARLLAGQVMMDVNYGLEPDEITAGYILTCQSHPLSERVVVDYD